MPVLVALSATHLLNDMMQSLIPAIYPIIKAAHGLDFGQIGLITLTFQVTASLFQPLIGHYTDRNPMPYSMVVGMGFTFAGLIGLAFAASYPLLLAGAACVGHGSSRCAVKCSCTGSCRALTPAQHAVAALGLRPRGSWTRALEGVLSVC